MTESTPSDRTTEQLLAETDWLRRLAVQLVADPHRADDLAQDTLMSALRYPPDPRTGLRPWLARVARNLATRYRTRDDNRRRREQLTAAAEVTTPVEDALVKLATHRAVVDAVHALDEPYRGTILLRYWEDLPVQDIARLMAVPVETVRTRLKRGLQRLRQTLDEGVGSRAGWAVPLAGLTSVHPAAFAPPAVALGGVASMKKLILAVVAVLLFAAAYPLWGGGVGPPSATTTGDTAETRIADTEATGAVTATGGRDAARPARRTLDAEVKGSLLVRVAFAGQIVPIDGITLYLRRSAGDHAGRDVRTSGAGRVEFTELDPGRYTLLPDRGAPRALSITAGQRLTVDLELPRGVDIRGEVVDATGQPVAGAQVFRAAQTHHDLALRVATTDAAGRFELGCVTSGTQLFARAAHWQPSGWQRVGYRVGAPEAMRLQLGAAGQSVSGRVLLESGAPAAGALVGLAVDETRRRHGDDWIPRRGSDRALDRETILLRADPQGWFHSDEVPTGDLLLLARGGAPASAQVAATLAQVGLGHNEVPTLQLGPGASVVGTVHDEHGAPLEGLDLGTVWRGTPALGKPERELGEWMQSRTAVTDAAGVFTVVGLVPGEHGLSRRNGETWHHLRRIEVTAGCISRIDLTVARTWHLRVRLLDASDHPLPGWGLAPHRFMRYGDTLATTDGNGRANLQVTRGDEIDFSLHPPRAGGARGFEELPGFVGHGARGMDEQVIRLAGDLALTAVVRGQYIGPLANPRDGGRTMTVILERVGFRGETRVTPARDGTFRFGPLAPGSYVLGARIHAVPEVLVEFTLRAGETKDLGPLQLPLPGRIVGQVLDATGRPRTDVRIEVRRLGGDASRADVSDRLCRLDPQRQAWVVTSLPPGDYAFTARTLGAVGQVERVRVLAGETAQVTIRARRGVEQRFVARLRANPEQARHPRASQQGRVGFCIRDARGNTVLDRRFEATWTDRDQRVVEFTFRFAPGRYTARLEDHWGNAYPGNHRIVEFVIEAARPAAPIVVEFRK